jgi:ribosome assembly protein YihI (activator of Der GTPase)
MDPDANLKEQLEIARAIRASYDDCNADGTLTEGQQQYVAEIAERFSELALALDVWISKGGFLPARWRNA